jgi:hypothetical protein
MNASVCLVHPLRCFSLRGSVVEGERIMQTQRELQYSMTTDQMRHFLITTGYMFEQSKPLRGMDYNNPLLQLTMEQHVKRVGGVLEGAQTACQWLTLQATLGCPSTSERYKTLFKTGAMCFGNNRVVRPKGKTTTYVLCECHYSHWVN